MAETRESEGPVKEEPSVQQSTEEQPSIRLDWSAADDVPVQRVNVVKVQFMGTDMLLTLGIVLPPVAMSDMNTKQTEKYLRENSVPIKQITRALLSREAVMVLASQLPIPSPVSDEDPASDEETES